MAKDNEFKIFKKGSRADYRGKRVKVEEILLNKALVCNIVGKRKVSNRCRIVKVNQLKNISPKPRT